MGNDKDNDRDSLSVSCDSDGSKSSYHMVESLPGNCLIWLSVKRYIYNLVRYAYLLYPVSVHVFLIVYEFNVS